MRPSGTRARHPSRIDSGSSAVIAVSMNPGATAFTRMLRPASSCASDFVNASSPAFAIVYGDWPALPV